MTRTHIQFENRSKRSMVGFLIRACLGLGMVSIAGAGVVFVSVYRHYSRDLPTIRGLTDYRPATKSLVFGADGILVGRFGQTNRTVVSLHDMPDHLVHAFVSAEDRRFFSHPGVDWWATARAFVANTVAGRTVQGASTLTQQVCKSIVGGERSYTRKIREAILARRLETILTKSEILTIYLNEIYLGSGAYGVAAAAQRYFGKRLNQLTIAESAMLASLPPEPSRVNPIRALKRSKQRQLKTLAGMLRDGVLTSRQAKDAGGEVIKIRALRGEVSQVWAPYYVENARRELAQMGIKLNQQKKRLQIHLGLRLSQQRSAQDALAKALIELSERQGFRGPLERVPTKSTEAFLKRAARRYDGPKTLRLGQVYVGLVHSVSSGRVHVSIGELSASLHLDKTLDWAKPYRRDVKHNGGSLADASGLLQPGDVILVRGHTSPNRGEIHRVYLTQLPSVQGALVGMDHRLGTVSALVGGFDFDHSEFDRTTQACRAPGSLFKPVVFGEALERGYTLASMLDDTPLRVFDGKTGQYWKPRNADGLFRGRVTLSQALTQSLNIPAIRMLRHLGAKKVIERARAFGIRERLHADDPLALGASCLAVRTVVNTYGTFASRGRVRRGEVIRRIINDNSRLLLDRTHPLELTGMVSHRIDGMLRALDNPPHRALSESNGFLMQTALKRIIDRGTGRGARRRGHFFGGKTGTTDKFDAWFAGFSEQMTGVVWIGSDNNSRPIGRGETGGKIAIPVWNEWMATASRGRSSEDFLADRPKSVTFVRIDPKTGLLAVRRGEGLKLGFKKGTEPTDTTEYIQRNGDDSVETIEGDF